MTGIRVNIDFLNKTLWATDNNRETTIALTRQLGMMASALEHQVPESLFSNEEYPGEAVSAVKALAIAAKEGQRIYTVTRENVSSVLPVLNVRSDVKDDIRNAVTIGKVATVSQNQITVGSWTGVGYIITDPNIGTGAYMISGGEKGGFIETFNEGGYIWILATLINALTGIAMLYMAGSFVFPLLVLLIFSIFYANIAIASNECIYFRWTSFSFFTAVASGAIFSLAAIPIAFGATLPSFTWLEVVMLELFAVLISWTGSDYGPRPPSLPPECSET